MKRISSILIALLFVLILVGCGKNTFTVTFESNGGSAVQAIVDVEEDSMIDEPTAPTKSGFVFAGWFKESTLENGWNFEVDTVTSNLTLYAKWTDAEPTDQELVDAAYTWLSLGDLSALTNSSARIIMPVSKDDVAISWVIDKLEYIATNGLITQPTYEDGDQTVTLTATITLGAVTRTKVFTATVIALPSVEETEPLINETFEDYADGNIVTQTGLWGPVSGKSGNSEFTVVSTITGMSIPEGSKALKIQALLELQIEAPIVHAYDLVVIEVDLMQTASSNGSSINVQSSSSSPVIGFGLDGAGLFYRTDNGSLMTTPIEINTWYTLRVEINLANKTIEAFYYVDGQLMSLTPGPVTYAGTTSLQSLFIRAGSSTTTVLREPAYITNIVANRIEALPRPNEAVKLGGITGITPTVNVELGTTFTPEVPVVRNFYGSQRLLVEDTEYTLVVTNPVDVNTVGEYEVSYVFTNVSDTTDVVTVTQDVTVYSLAEPNVITAVESTVVGYLEHLTDVTLTAVQPEGTLYYLLNNSATATAEEIKLGTSLSITGSSVVLSNVNAEDLAYIHFVIVNNGDSNVWSHTLVNEVVIEVATVAEFYAMAAPAVDTYSTYALVADLDFTGFTWTDTNGSFKGIFYGNLHTISNITINAVNGYGGIFARANGSTIRDLVVDHANITTTARAGILVGRVENNPVSLLNIIIMNSSVSGADSNGVGGLVGLVSKNTTIENIAIIDSTVTSVGQKNVGGVVGRVDGGTLLASDVYVRGVTVTSTVAGETTLDVGAGAFVGYVRDSITSIVTANRIVIIESEVNAVVGGALIGYIRFAGSATIENSYVEVAFTNLAINAAGLVGRVNNETDKIAETTIFGSLTNAVAHLQTQDLSHSAAPDGGAWWGTNLSAFVDHAFWTLDTNHVYALNLYLASSKPFVEVTVSYNITVDDEVLHIRQDNLFTHEAPIVAGYNFTGWYTDALLTTPLTPGYIVTVPVTLYGKYETAPASTVSFSTNVVDLIVDDQLVNYGQLATEPVVADQMIDLVMKEVTGWTLGDVAFDFSTPIVGDITLVAVWTTKIYTVTFDGVDSVDVEYGQLAIEPAVDPTHEFSQVVFDAWKLSGVTYDFSTPVVANLALTSGFVQIEDIPVTTTTEFIYMVSYAHAFDFILTNDLDFTGVEWIQTGNGTAFTGTFDGAGYTISNITITDGGVGAYGGIFQRTNGATIENLAIDNASINVVGRAGVLVGRHENNTLTINNLSIMNSSVAGTAGEGVGILIGNASSGFVATNIQIINSSAYNLGKNVSFIVGRADNIATLTDIYIVGSTIETAQASTDAGVGGFVGYTNNAAANINITRAVIQDSELNGRSAGSLVGYYRYGALSVDDVFIDVAYTYTGIDGLQGIIGRRNVDLNTTDPVLVNVFEHSIGMQIGGTSVQLAPAYVLADLTGLNDLWWTTNLPNVTGSTLWNYDVFTSFYVTVEVAVVETFIVTFDSNGGSLVDQMTEVPVNTTITAPNDPTKDGFIFQGWYEDVLLTLAWNFDLDVVVANTTLYAKWEAVPVRTVTLVTNVVDLTVDPQLINDGSLAIEPVVADQMIDLVMKEVTGWTLNDVAFDFSTPIVGDITLVAVWETKTYEVTFNGTDAVMIAYGDLVSEPVDPIHPMFTELTFMEWQLGGVAYDFNTPVTASINLAIQWNDPIAPLSISNVDQFYYMAMNSTAYAFVLANDLDFSSFTWNSNGGNFSGSFDGQNYTLTGINMSVGDRAGIFTYFSGTFENVVIEDTVVVSTGRAGLIAGEIDAETAVVTNVHFVNVSVTGASDNGVGAIAGVIKDGAGGLTASVISVINSSFTNNNKNVGALLGYVRGSGATVISDVYIKNVTVLGQVDQVGGIAGYVRNPLSFSLTNVVMDGVNITQIGAGGYAASVVGRIDTTTVIDIQNLIVINDTITAVKYANTIVGRYDTVSATLFTLTNVYSGTSVITGTVSGQAALTIVDPLTLNAAWFGTNMPTITTPNWDLSSDIPKLTNTPTIS